MLKKAQIFIIPFAGGSYYSFQFLIPYLKDFEVVPLELPGRGKRITENLLTDIDLAILDIYNQIKLRLTNDLFFIYGHSMGAILALGVSEMLEKEKKAPLFLFVSGNPGPGVVKETKRYLLEEPQFIEELKKLGGVPDELLNDLESLKVFLPILKADFEISEKREIAISPALKLPIFAMMGDEEEKAKQIVNWRKYTTSDFDYEIVRGGHFFIYKYPVRIASIIKNLFNVLK